MRFLSALIATIPLLPSTLIISPNSYIKHRQVHECYEEGIYRFVSYPNGSVQRIVYNGNVLVLLESMTWLHLHGYRDNYLTTEQALEKAKIEKLSMTCQPICCFFRDVLKSCGINARTVSFITLEPPNGYNDGHRMLEVEIDGDYVCVDVTTRSYFRRSGKLLSAEELLEHGIDDVEIVQFSDAPILSYNDLRYNNHDFTLEDEEIFFKNGNIRDWYRRICQSINYN